MVAADVRAPKVCSDPECPNIQPCPDHERKPWQGSKRKERTKLNGWKQQKRARYILMKHKTVCHICGYPGGTEVDHVEPLAEGGADDESNLRPAHVECHKRKTAEEAARGRG